MSSSTRVVVECPRVTLRRSRRPGVRRHGHGVWPLPSPAARAQSSSIPGAVPASTTHQAPSGGPSGYTPVLPSFGRDAVDRMDRALWE